MDAEQFDSLTRGLFTALSRRRTIGTLLAGSLGPPGLSLAEAKKNRKKRRKRRRKRKRKHRDHKKHHRSCYRGTHCVPGPGQDNARCDYSHSLDLFELDVHGADLSGANLTEAELAGANLSGANLEGACLVGANLITATIDGSTKLDGAIFCRTLMPDGSFNDEDCGKGSRCCPAPFSCEGEQCPQACIGAPNAQCSFNVPYGGCCPGLHCVPSSTSPFRTTCQAPCHEDGGCRARFGSAWICAPEPRTCRYLGGECCQHR